MGSVFFIVAADRSDLFEKLAAEFPELVAGHVILLDRRRLERRQQNQSVDNNRRRVERRTRRIERELESVGLAIVAAAAGL